MIPPLPLKERRQTYRKRHKSVAMRAQTVMNFRTLSSSFSVPPLSNCLIICLSSSSGQLLLFRERQSFSARLMAVAFCIYINDWCMGLCGGAGYRDRISPCLEAATYFCYIRIISEGSSESSSVIELPM